MPEHARGQVHSGNPGSDRWKYGLWAVLSGLAALVIVYIAALVRYSSPADVAPLLGPALATIGTLTAAYFGIQAGAAGKEQADAAKDAAHVEAMRFAAIADPDRAAQLLGLSTGPDSPDPSGAPAGPTTAPTTEQPTDTEGVLGWGYAEEDSPPTAERTSESPQPKQRPLGES